MSRAGWCLVDLLSRMLEPDEREAVRGDVAESGEPAARALRDVLGLAMRRQVGLWKSWRPWLAVFGLVGVVAVPLSRVLLGLDVSLQHHVRIYLRYGVHEDTGMSLGADILAFLIPALALFTLVWTSSFVLASLSGRTIWITGPLFYLMSVNWRWVVVLLTGHQVFRDGRISMMVVAALLLPFSVGRILFVIAAVGGTRQGRRCGTLQFRNAMLLAALVVLLTGLATWTGGWAAAARVAWSGGQWGGPSTAWYLRLAPFALMAWPAGYVVLTANRRRRVQETTA